MPILGDGQTENRSTDVHRLKIPHKLVPCKYFPCALDQGFHLGPLLAENSMLRIYSGDVNNFAHTQRAPKTAGM